MIIASMSLVGHQTCVRDMISNVSFLPSSPGSCGSSNYTKLIPALGDPEWEKGAVDPIPCSIVGCAWSIFLTLCRLTDMMHQIL